MELGLEREVDAVRAVHDRDQRLGRQRFQLERQLAGPVAQRALVVDVRDQPLEQLDLRAQRRVARLRVLSDALEPSLDVVPIGDEQLQLERRQVVGIADDGEQRIGAAHAAELSGGRARNIDQPDRRRCLLREPTTSATCGSRSSAIGAIPTCGVP